MKVAFIVNPVSGGGKGEKAAKVLLGLVDQAKIEGKIEKGDIFLP
ncbi:hypothetical protein ACFL11_00315 [Patescibacteria group bacterium]